MEAKARDIHIVDCLSGIQRGHLHSQTLGVGWLDACLAAGFEKPFQALVSKRDDHAMYFSVLRIAQQAPN
jgi:hypothetical protein